MTSPERSNVLEVRDLAVRYGRVEVFSRLSFDVSAGDALAIIGPNGSGKTQLLRALIGAVPYEGTLHWAPGIRIGYVPQKLDIGRDAPITALEFLQARAALAHKELSDARDLLGAVGLPAALGSRSIGALSGGQFQRLLVAFALVGDPNVLLLDEPTASVDEPGQEQLNELIHRLQRDRGLTTVLVSHDLSVVYRYATAVLCLGRQTRCFGKPREVLTPDRLHELYGTPPAFHVHDA